MTGADQEDVHRPPEEGPQTGPGDGTPCQGAAREDDEAGAFGPDAEPMAEARCDCAGDGGGPQPTEGVRGDAGCPDTSENVGAVTCAEALGLLEGIQRAVAALHVLFVDKIANSESDDKTITRLHSELQQHKDGLYAEMLKPLIMDLIEIHGIVIYLVGKMGSEPQDVRAKDLQECADQIEGVLEKHGVLSYKSEPGDAFVPARHRVINREETEDPGLHRKVSKSLSSGYESNGKILRPEKVTVFHHPSNKENK